MSDQNSHAGHGDHSGAFHQGSHNAADGKSVAGHRDSGMTPPDGSASAEQGDAHRAGQGAAPLPLNFGQSGFRAYPGALSAGAVGGLVRDQRRAGGVPEMPGWGPGALAAWSGSGGHQAVAADHGGRPHIGHDDASALQQHREPTGYDDAGHEDPSRDQEPQANEPWGDSRDGHAAEDGGREAYGSDGDEDYGAEHRAEGHSDLEDQPADDLVDPDLTVGGAERKKGMPLVGKLLFGGGGVLMFGLFGYVIASSLPRLLPSGGAETVRLEELEPQEALPPMPRGSVVDPMTAMVAVRPPTGVSAVGGAGRETNAHLAAPTTTVVKPYGEAAGAAVHGNGAGDLAGAAVANPPTIAPTPAPAPAPTPMTVSSTSGDASIGVPLQGGIGGINGPWPAPGGAPAVSNEQVMAAVTGLVTQVSALAVKVEASAKPAGEDPSIAALRGEIAAMRAQIAALPTANTKPAAVKPEPAKAPTGTNGQKSPVPSSANRQAKPLKQPASAERDASHKGCKLLGATDATFGGSGGTAWISAGRQEAKQVEVGGRAPCIGVVKSIQPDGTTWVVRGSGGTLRLANGS